MPCQILVANLCAVPKAEWISLVDGEHQWAKNETMQAWVTSGEDVDDWPRTFSLVVISDRSLEEMEWFRGKLVVDIDGTLTATDNKYHFTQPDPESEFFQSLYFNGEVTVTFAELEHFIVERT